MKIRIAEINPNPFKKWINHGELNEEGIQKIIANLKELGFMGSLPVFFHDGKYFLIAGHHRLEAIKRVFGVDYEVKVDIKDYSEEQILRGMVIENLSQRGTEHIEERENLVLVRDFLKKKLKKANISASEISDWIDKKEETVISLSKIQTHLLINDNLSEELKALVSKKKGGVSVLVAEQLARVKNPKEQEYLYKAIEKVKQAGSSERPHKILEKYRLSSENIKRNILSGETPLADVGVENLKEDITKMEKKKEDKKNKTLIVVSKETILRETQNIFAKTNENLLKSCIFINDIKHSLHHEEVKKVLRNALEVNKKYSTFLENALKYSN